MPVNPPQTPPPAAEVSPVQWLSKYATGVTEIDRQHQELFSWFAQLESAAADQRLMTAAYFLTRLMQYTRSHFAAEEHLMAESGYPRLDAHHAEHEAFRQHLRELQAHATVGDLGDKTVDLLREWLVKHIMLADMDYVPYVRGTSPMPDDTAH